MRLLGARFAIGVIIFIVGALIVVELAAGVALPIVRAVIAALLVVLGARMIVHAWARRDRSAVSGEAVLSARNFSQRGALDRDARFDVVLGRGTIDLSELAEPEHDVTVTVDTLFGHAVVKVPAIAYDVEGSAAFGEVRMPDRTASAMGSLVYRAASDHAPRLHLRISAVFGACQVIEAGA